MNVLSVFSLDEALAAELKAADPQIHLVIATSQEALLAHAASAEVIFAGYAGENPAPFHELLRRAHRLRWIHVSSAGVDALLFPELKARGTHLTCAKGEVVGSLLAEHAMALLLSLTRDIAVSVRAGRWDRAGKPGRTATELRGKTLGIVGFGGAGQALARMAAGFQMRVLALRRHPAASPVAGVEEVWGPERLHDLLERSDVVALCAPATPETRNLIGRPELQKMKRTAILINIGRGDVVNQEALIEALESRRIAAAGLDVLAVEPVPDGSPLWRMDHVVITPHIAGHSPLRNARNQESFVRNFCRFARGEALEGEVALDMGY
ncbi:MAG: D-2-hydroxyacid dehydrogenase [Planctomycetes bacterium]|nr:D-2-hydroxyacid dehydrogenase [Planctomycetota bacterium]